MKTKAALIIGLILLSWGECFSQSTLSVYFEDCRNEGGIESMREFTLLRNDSLIEAVKPNGFDRLDRLQLIEDLPNGIYRIDYETMFGKIESTLVEIPTKGDYRVGLCFDYIDYDKEVYIPFIDRLQNGETYSINFASQGCFQSWTESVTILKKRGKLLIRCGDIERELDPTEIQKLGQFEIELRYMDTGGCTTLDTYVVAYGNHMIRIQDGNCSWRGYLHLKKNLDRLEH